MTSIGPLTAINLLVLTNAFTDITHYCECASYLGISPNKRQSGTSLNKADKSDRFGPARMRKLLHLAARSIITHDQKYREYYLRKTAAGKPKMLVLNNIANKILRTCFAMIRNQRVYDPNHVSMNPNLVQST